jgi:hypothetical protein
VRTCYSWDASADATEKLLHDVVRDAQHGKPDHVHYKSVPAGSKSNASEHIAQLESVETASIKDPIFHGETDLLP